jgi:hypothetical protein
MAEELASSSKSQRAKNMLDFIQTTEGQASSLDKNVLNIPYTDSEEDLESVEGEIPDLAAPKEAPFLPKFPGL